MKGFIMKVSLVVGLLLSAISVQAQVRDLTPPPPRAPEVKVYDDSITFKVINDQLIDSSYCEICLYDMRRELCIENLTTGFKVLFYDENGMFWSSIWNGSSFYLPFKQKFKKGDYMVIQAFKPHVTNVSSGDRVWQHKTIEITYYLE